MTTKDIIALAVVTFTAMLGIVLGSRPGRRGVDEIHRQFAVSWTCHVCGKWRPDAFVSVRSFAIKDAPPGWVRNVRHCNDRPECVNGAEKMAKTQK